MVYVTILLLRLFNCLTFMKKVFFLIFCLILAISYSKLARADSAAFNPNYLLADHELLDYSAMSVQDIQAFLESKNSWLAAYRTFDANGAEKSAAEIIYNAAIDNFNCDNVTLSAHPSYGEKKFKCLPQKTINPKFLLVLLQKEQALIENTNPEQSRLNWATGYGCPDSGGCNTRWKGFGKQVNSAALQFRDYMDHPELYKFKAGQTHTFTNPYASGDKRASTVVTIANNATAALYNFTPHVYNGNYNFWVIWNRYFRSFYPNGTLLQAKGSPGVWLVQSGLRRPFLSWSAFVSRFDSKKILQVDPAVLDSMEIGAPLRFPQYSIVKSPEGALYLLVDDQRRPFIDEETFRLLGYNPDEVMEATAADLAGYSLGKSLTALSVYPTGALLQNKQTGGVYWVQDGGKAPILDPLFLQTQFKGRKISPVNPAELEKYQTVEPVKFNDGELVRMEKALGVYVVEGNRLRPIKSAEVFEAMGYKWENIITISPKLFTLYYLGETLAVAGQ